jgi:hypothetical protein
MLNDQLCDRNALAAQVETFLACHGGRAGNHLKPRGGAGSDLAALLPRLLARYELDLRTASREAAASADRLAAAEVDRRRLARVLAAETQRADAKERECAEWQARHASLRDAAAAQIAQLELEVEHWCGAAGSGFVERAVQRRRFALVLPGLLAALTSGQDNEEARAVATLEGLGIMDREGIAQHLEGRLMVREDLARHASAAISAAHHAPVDARDGGAAGGGKKGGKSPKKGGAKKKIK